MKKINILHKYVTYNNVFVSKYIKCIRTFFFWLVYKYTT